LCSARSGAALTGRGAPEHASTRHSLAVDQSRCLFRFSDTIVSSDSRVSLWAERARLGSTRHQPPEKQGSAPRNGFQRVPARPRCSRCPHFLPRHTGWGGVVWEAVPTGVVGDCESGSAKTGETSHRLRLSYQPGEAATDSPPVSPKHRHLTSLHPPYPFASPLGPLPTPAPPV
jgi:hypothetical protein